MRHSQVLPVVGSSLWRTWSLLLLATGRSAPEECEIGEQGGLTVGHCLLVYPSGRTLALTTVRSDNQSIWRTPNCERGLWATSTSCFAENTWNQQGWKVVTWLILPVVICLSQRLSHACLSINKFVLWNCEWLIKSVIVYLMVSCYMDNCGNSRANTCNQAPTSGRGVFIR